MLSAPEVVLPVTPCTRKVHVRNQLPGAMVTIFADGVPVGRRRCDWANDFVPLDPGQTLAPHQRITAVQEKDGEPGDTAVEGVEVLEAPQLQQLDKLYSPAQVVECGTSLRIEGVIPGATVTLQVNQAAPLTVVAEGTMVAFDWPTGFQRTDSMTVSQAACGVQGPPVPLPAPLPLAQFVLPLEAPEVAEPLHACQRILPLSNLCPGATVFVTWRRGVERYRVGTTETNARLSGGLEMGDVLKVRQEFAGTHCEVEGRTREVTVTEPAPAPPGFPYPVCSGDRQLTLGGVEDEGVLQFFLDDDPRPFLQSGGASGSKGINIPPLGQAQMLGVRQALCPLGPWSEIRWTGIIPQSTGDHPGLIDPVYDRAVAVGVKGLSAGSRVMVYSAAAGGPIALGIGSGDEIEDIALDYPLKAGDQLHLGVIQCGVFVLLADVTTVQPAPEFLPAPELNLPADDVGGSVYVHGLTPGAFVDLEAVDREDADPSQAGRLLRSHPATSSSASVAVPVLPEGTLLRARQRMIHHASQPSIVTKLVYGGLEWKAVERICQLTGASDPTGLPHPVDSTQVQLIETDLGISVEHRGRLYFFFGDSKKVMGFGPLGPYTISEGDGDPIGWTVDPPRADLLRMRWVVNEDGVYRRLVVDGLPPLGNFEVPTGAFSYGGKLYVFIARHKTENTDPTNHDHQMRRSHLAVGDDPQNNFRELFQISSSLENEAPDAPAGRWLVHISPVVVRNADWPTLPFQQGEGLFLFGTSLYHESNVYLAWTPLKWGQDPPRASTWRFYTGAPGNEWLTLPEADFLNVQPKPLLNLSPAETRLGELSVKWSPVLRRWLMTYGNNSLQVARYPWGPWIGPELIVDVGNPARDAGNHLPNGNWVASGVTYAPYQVEQWTRWDKSNRRVTLYYVLTAANPPYQPMLMKTTLAAG